MVSEKNLYNLILIPKQDKRVSIAKVVNVTLIFSANHHIFHQALVLMKSKSGIYFIYASTMYQVKTRV